MVRSASHCLYTVSVSCFVLFFHLMSLSAALHLALLPFFPDIHIAPALPRSPLSVWLSQSHSGQVFAFAPSLVTFNNVWGLFWLLRLVGSSLLTAKLAARFRQADLYK